MRPLLKQLFNSIQEDFGRPASLYDFLAAHPDLSLPTLDNSVRNVASESVVKWHEFGESRQSCPPCRNRTEMLGWRYARGSYSSFVLSREEFADIGSCTVTEQWECDIQDVTGLAASKSVLEDFDDLDRMVETNSLRMIEPVTEEKLRENLAWDEIRILNRKDPSDFFARYLWDGRVFLINSGGSHHFAAARYIAARIGTPVPLRGTLRTYAINPLPVVSLRSDFEMFVMVDTTDATLGFFEAMQGFRATFLWQYLPSPIEGYRVIMLPRSETRSMKVASILREAGFFDLGQYLMRLVSSQQAR